MKGLKINGVKQGEKPVSGAVFEGGITQAMQANEGVGRGIPHAMIPGKTLKTSPERRAVRSDREQS